MAYLYLDGKEGSSVAVGQNYKGHWNPTHLPDYLHGENLSLYEGDKDIPATVVNPKNDKKYTVTKIAYYAFASATNVHRVSLPYTIEEIEEFAFYFDSGLNIIDLNAGLKIIGKEAFNGCVNLNDITIPDSVTDLGPGAFANCKSMTKAIIGAGIASIDKAFIHCENLREIICRATNPPVINEGTFDEKICEKATLYVPFSSLKDYKTAANWKEFGKIEPIPETIPQNGENAIENNTPVDEPILISEPIRYISLKNNGIFDARIRVKCDRTYEIKHNIHSGKEKTVDLADAVNSIKEGDEIGIEIVVVAGKSKTAKEHFVYSATSNKKARYIIKGTTLNNSLSFRGIKE